MIVSMEKLALLVPSELSEKLLLQLQKLGVVQLEERAEAQPIVNNAQKLAERFMHAQKLLQSAYQTRLREGLMEGVTPLQIDATTPVERLEQAEAALEECDSSHAHWLAMQQELAEWELWGEFDPAQIQRLLQHSVSIRFVKVSSRQLEAARLVFAEEKSGVVEIFERQRSHYLLLVDHMGELPAGVEELSQPQYSLEERRRRLAEADERAALARRQIASLAADLSLLQQGWHTAENESRLTAASHQLQSELQGAVVSATGWLPTSKRADIEKLLQSELVWYELRPPADDEEPPIQLENRSFAKLFEPIATLHSLPRYRELDPVPYFSVFFAFFVGCCLGDAAYGALVLTLALVGRKIAPASLKPLFSLLAVLGGSTIFCGTIFNSFFGESLPLPAWLTPLAADLETSDFPMMSLALVVGFIQILFAMGLRVYSSFKYQSWREAMEPLSYMLLTVGALIWSANASAEAGELLGLKIHTFNVNGLSFGGALASVPQSVGTGLMAAGALLIVLFTNAGASPVMRYSFLAVWSIYNYITKIISDALSYLRLFALGLAGGLLAASFNTIALMLVTSGDGGRNYLSPLLLGTILILVIGHALNLVLAFIGGLVHPLRLTFVEFYSNMDYQGGGKAFAPLKLVDKES